MVALHPPLTLRAVADLDVEAPHDRAHHGQFFLVLRRHAGHFDRAAAVRTRRRDRRRNGSRRPRRARAAAVAAILRTGPPIRDAPRPCGRSLANGGPAGDPLRRASSNCRFRRSTCCFRRSTCRCRRSFALLPLCVALAPRQLPLEPFDFGVQVLNPILIRTPVRGRHANVMPQVPNLYNCQNLDGRVPSTLTEDAGTSPSRALSLPAARIGSSRKYQPSVSTPL